MKTDNTHIFNRFTGYSLEDCDCLWCLNYQGRKKCPLPVCCCAEEKRLAMERLNETAQANNTLSARTEVDNESM